jgi:hypothetical protein
MPYRSLVLCLFVCFSAQWAEANGDCSPLKYVTNLGDSFSVSRPLIVNPPDTLLDPYRVSRDAVIYSRLRIHWENQSDTLRNWHLSIRDSKFRPLQQIGPQDFNAEGVFVTNRLPGKKVWFDLISDDAKQPKLTVNNVHYTKPNAENYSFSAQDPDDPGWSDLYSGNSSDKRLGDSVGIIVFKGVDSPPWSCTGFAISKSLFLTNWHCGGIPPANSAQYWNSAALLRNAVIDFSWHHGGESQKIFERNQYKISAANASTPNPVHQDQDLDYAVLRIEPINRSNSLRVAKLSIAEEATGAIKIIHHPLGEKKQLTTGCAVDESIVGWRDVSKKTEFTHNCDTEGGSSGSPVFNASNKVVGLHHAGYSYDQDCKNPDNKNKAVKIRDIWNSFPAQLKKEITGW